MVNFEARGKQSKRASTFQQDLLQREEKQFIVHELFFVSLQNHNIDELTLP